LEDVMNAYFNKQADVREKIEVVRRHHYGLIDGLFEPGDECMRLSMTFSWRSTDCRRRAKAHDMITYDQSSENYYQNRLYLNKIKFQQNADAEISSGRRHVS
jgi:hypothetical protein